ncbi:MULTISPECIES: hypothetical protein [unclassified Streptomyces]|uniref:hypothetical protein n=1 Tax=unclassified Streptomyces TaxID=2593676 RepID=UPI0038083590
MGPLLPYGLRVTEPDTLHATREAHDAVATTYAQMFEPKPTDLRQFREVQLLAHKAWTGEPTRPVT